MAKKFRYNVGVPEHVLEMYRRNRIHKEYLTDGSYHDCDDYRYDLDGGDIFTPYAQVAGYIRANDFLPDLDRCMSLYNRLSW